MRARTERRFRVKPQHDIARERRIFLPRRLDYDMLANALCVEICLPIIFPIGILHDALGNRAGRGIKTIRLRQPLDARAEGRNTPVELVVDRQIRLHHHAPSRCFALRILDHDTRRPDIIKTRRDEVGLLLRRLDADFRPLQSLRAPLRFSKKLCPYHNRGTTLFQAFHMWFPMASSKRNSASRSTSIRSLRTSPFKSSVKPALENST